MISFLFTLFNVFLFSKDISILWYVSDQNSVYEIEKFKKENSLNFDIDILSSSKLDISTSSFEFCALFGENIPLAAIFFPSKISFLKNKLNDMPEVFNLVFDKYYERFKYRKCIFFYPGILNNEILNYLKNKNYAWVGVLKNLSNVDVYNFDSTKVVSFEKILSTNTIYTSSSSFFILDNDISTNTAISILKSILPNKDINFVRVSENFNFKNSTISFSTSTFEMDTSFNFSCDKQKNYFIYLSKLVSDFSKVDNIVNIMEDYLILLDYFPIVCSTDNVDDIRNITTYIYQILGLEVPDYVYDDFLNKNIISGYTRILKDNSIFYIPDMDDKPVFSVSLLDDNLYFNIEKSTSIKEFYIYIDINKISRVGVEKSLTGDFSFHPDFAWEYALAFKNGKLSLYKIIGRDYKKIKDLNISKKESSFSFSLNTSNMPGNFLNWDYILTYYTDDGKKDGIYFIVSDKFLKPVK